MPCKHCLQKPVRQSSRLKHRVLPDQKRLQVHFSKVVKDNLLSNACIIKVLQVYTETSIQSFARKCMHDKLL